MRSKINEKVHKKKSVYLKQILVKSVLSIRTIHMGKMEYKHKYKRKKLVKANEIYNILDFLELEIN